MYKQRYLPGKYAMKTQEHDEKLESFNELYLYARFYNAEII